MGALTASRDTKKRSGEDLVLPVAAAVKCFQGGLAALDANGDVKPGATATTLKGLGRFRHTADNTGGDAGDITAEVEKGVFLFDNSTDTEEITTAEIGADCYIVDDQTVAKTDGAAGEDPATRSVAGKVFDVTSQGVWVKFD